ncbi:hypothetical protein MKEN_00444000 [Mycena kentingensis (nom. inval.)]|nr:hypothetical protein MKEN_00444000 [Mycena kentingensis (nom. inval.)]
MLTITFVRHGQSQDNLKNIWAGWKDAPLSDLGVQQAAALGRAFRTSDTKFDHIYASDLKRANATGRAIHDAHCDPKPPFTTSTKLREQHFGIGEGHPWVLNVPSGNRELAELFTQNIFPVLRERDARFPEGESLDDLARRADSAIAEFVVPHLEASASKDVHIAIASHGLCISELVAALLRLDPDSERGISYSGLMNTAWTRAVVTVKDPALPVAVQVTHVNVADHLAQLNVIELQEDVDDSRAAARAFFGGKAVA